MSSVGVCFLCWLFFQWPFRQPPTVSLCHSNNDNNNNSNNNNILIHPSGKLKLSFERTTKNISQ